MSDLFARHAAALFFPLFFIALWLAVCSILNAASGYSRLATIYPDQPGRSRLRLSFQSGWLGSVRCNNLLSLAVMDPGLRVAIPRLFSPFCRPCLVPWSDISVTRRRGFFGPVTTLAFGDPVVGSLTIAADAADRLAIAAAQAWPDSEPVAPQLRGHRGKRLFKEWALASAAGSAFFSLFALLPASTDGPPIWMCILAPALFFGVATLIKSLLESGR